MAVKLSASRTVCSLIPPPSPPKGIFLVIISVTARVNSRAVVMLEGLVKLKKSNDLLRNPTRNLPACIIKL
jgi:hypothetical protein